MVRFSSAAVAASASFPRLARLLAFVQAGALSAQTVVVPAPGHAATTRYRALGVQHGIDALAATDGGALFVAHQTWLYAVDATGNRQLVHSLPASHQFGAMTFEPRSGAVLATDWTARILIAHFPGGSTQALGPVPANTFDLALVPGTSILLAAANPNWPSPGAWPGIWRVDPPTPPRELIRLAGASGPLVITADGSLIAATVSATYPAPPGSSRLLRWSAAQLTRALAGGALLTVADAVVVGPPFDGAYDLAHDDRGQIYVSDGLRGQVWQVDLASGARARLPLLATGGAGTTHLAWRRGSGPATFAPYQPAGGGELLAVVADWASVQSEAVAITAQRPGLTVQPGNPVPHGAAAVLAEGLAPNAPSALFVSPLPAQPEQALPFAMGMPLWLGLDERIAPWAWPASADAQGRASWSFWHRGGNATLTLQALTVPAGGIGSSAPLPLTLQ
jgi:hypothetical protein